MSMAINSKVPTVYAGHVSQCSFSAEVAFPRLSVDSAAVWAMYDCSIHLLCTGVVEKCSRAGRTAGVLVFFGVKSMYMAEDPTPESPQPNTATHQVLQWLQWSRDLGHLLR